MKTIRTRSRRPLAIGIHHSGKEGDTPYVLAKFHTTVESGVYQSEIGYNFVVDAKGTVHKGRDLGKVPAHCSGIDEETVGICVCGNYEEDPPSRRQMESLAEIIAVVCYAYDIDPIAEVRLSNKLVVHGVFSHRDVKNTDCPGRAFHREMDSLRRSVAVRLRDFAITQAKDTDITMHVGGKPKKVPVRLEKKLADEV